MNVDLIAAARIGDMVTLRAHGSQLLDEFDNYPAHVWQAAFETDRDLAESRAKRGSRVWLGKSARSFSSSEKTATAGSMPRPRSRPHLRASSSAPAVAGS